MKLKFDNITISGGVAVGKNTLYDHLKSYLEPLGWKFASGGTLNRERSQEYLKPEAGRVSDDFNRYIESRTRELLTSKDHYVIEAWLSGFVARELHNTLRVLLVCQNDALRVDRVANRERILISEAKKIIKERESANIDVWKRLYGDYNFFDPKYYTLVIDTYSSGQLETTGQVLDALGFDHGTITISKK